MSVESRLRDLCIELPALSEPSGNYVHAVRTGSLLFLAGKGPSDRAGKVGLDLSLEEAYGCARFFGLLLLAVMRKELGSLDRVERIVKVVGLVNSAQDFVNHPEVINGCSDLLVAVFGEKGHHARTSFGVASLPYGIPIEIEAVVEVR